MARPIKKGLDYFPLNVFLTGSVEYIECMYGAIGVGVTFISNIPLVICPSCVMICTSQIQIPTAVSVCGETTNSAVPSSHIFPDVSVYVPSGLAQFNTAVAVFGIHSARPPLNNTTLM